MNNLDIVICVIVGWCLVRGSMRGLLKEVFGFLAVFGGFYIAYTYYPGLAAEFRQWLFSPDSGWKDNPEYADVLAFFLYFVVGYAVISGIGVLIKWAFRMASLGLIDRIGGAVFGLVKGALISLVIIFVLTLFLQPGGTPIIRQSVLAPFLIDASKKFSMMVPEKTKQEVIIKANRLKDYWEAQKQGRIEQ